MGIYAEFNEKGNGFQPTPVWRRVRWNDTCDSFMVIKRLSCG